MDDIQQLKELFEAHERESQFTERLKIRNIMLGFIVPALYDFDAEPPEMQNIITRIADSVAAKNYRTSLYDFLRFQENPALKASDTAISLSGKFNDEKTYMPAFAEGFLSDLDMDLSPWGKFVLERMKQMRIKDSQFSLDPENKIIPFPPRK